MPPLPAALLLLAAPQDAPPADPLAGVRDVVVRRAVEELRLGLLRTGAGLRVVDVIEDLHGRYGAFADLDGDGDLDYVATEMSHATEEVALHLRDARGGWRRTSVRREPFGGKHPQIPWVLADDGSGHPAVVLPTGWPPYLYWFPTDGRGRFRGEPLPVGASLPERVHPSRGVDDLPYAITGVLSAGATHGARILGTLAEDRREDVAGAHAVWELELGTGGATLRSLALRDDDARIDWASLPRRVTPVPRTRCSDRAHDAPARRSIMASRLLDLDRDGVRDLVHFTGDFAAHVFPGVRDARTGVVTFGDELPGARPLPLEDAWLWFFDRAEAHDPEGGYAANAPEIFAKLDFTIETPARGDARVLMYGAARRAWLVEYFWSGEALVPLVWYRSCAPPPRTEEQDGWFHKPREQLLGDWDLDGAADTLMVVPLHAMRWLREPPDGSGFLVEGDDFAFLERERYAIVHLAGASDGPSRAVWYARRAAGVPEDRHLGLPIELARVPVQDGDRVVGERIAFLLRELDVGVFCEPPPPRERPTPFRTWLRRADQAFATARYFVACDARVLAGEASACVPSGPREPHGHRNTQWFLERAEETAHTPAQRAEVAHRLARCASRLEDLERGLEHYARYAEDAGSLEPLGAAHADLTWLFAQPRFRAWHALRARGLPLRVREEREAPGC